MAKFRLPWYLVGVALGAAAAAGITRLLAARPRIRLLMGPLDAPSRTLAPEEPFPHAEFSAVAAPIVDDEGLVNYERLLLDLTALYRFVAWVRAYSPVNTPEHFPTPSDVLAYWINAYNALALLAVIDAYPVTSMQLAPPRGQALSSILFPVGGQFLSLNEIGQGIIRPNFPDPRIYFTLCFAAMDSPRLRNEAYQPSLLEDQLETQTRQFMHNTANVEIDYPQHIFSLNRLFKWYEADFLAWVEAHRPGLPADILSYLWPYLPDAAQELISEDSYQIRYRRFVWRLNQSKQVGEETVGEQKAA